MDFEDRRKYKRFKVKEGTLAIEKGNIVLVGQVADISEKGLSFYYLDNGEPPGKRSEIGLYNSGQGIFCNKLAVENISDVILAKEATPVAATTIRRGVKFGTLSETQRTGIEKFIVSLEEA
ncbi:MAG: PilZ domain-containing protein [Desulfobacterales bacterium]|nr:PilZ domain-containing protein [Desulfobacterales bacterium]